MENLEPTQYIDVINQLVAKIISPEFFLVVLLTWLFLWASFEALEGLTKRKWGTIAKRLTAIILGGLFGSLVFDVGSVVTGVLYGVVAGGVAAGAVAELRRRGGTPKA